MLIEKENLKTLCIERKTSYDADVEQAKIFIKRFLEFYSVCNADEHYEHEVFNYDYLLGTVGIHEKLVNGEHFEAAESLLSSCIEANSVIFQPRVTVVLIPLLQKHIEDDRGD